MKHIKTFESFDIMNRKKSKDPIIEYKEEDNKFYMRNPSGGDWIEISKDEYENYQDFDKRGKSKTNIKKK